MSLFGRTKYTDEHLDWVFGQEARSRSEDWRNVMTQMNDGFNGIATPFMERFRRLEARVAALEGKDETK